MSVTKALASGAAGACALTLIHQAANGRVPNAPRVDIIGERAIAKSARALGYEPPDQPDLHRMALGGDLLSNSLYYSLAAAGHNRHPLLLGSLLGLIGGIGAVALPPMLGLGRRPVQKTRSTVAMTIAWYLIGGLVAGSVSSLLADESDDD